MYYPILIESNTDRFDTVGKYGHANCNYPEKYTRLMDESLETFVKRVEGILKENGHDTEFTNIIYVGGGAKIMAAYGRRGDNISYVTDVRANAKGYEYLARQIA